MKRILTTHHTRHISSMASDRARRQAKKHLAQQAPSLRVEVLEARRLLSAPAAPTSLHAMTVSTTQINLTWKDNSVDELGFYVDHSTTSNFSSNVSTVAAGANTGSKWITALTPGTTYYFRVRAWNTDGEAANIDMTPVAATPVAGTVRTVNTSNGTVFTRQRIVDAINASNDGDTIFIPAGTYNFDKAIDPNDPSIGLTKPLGKGRVYVGETMLATASDGTTFVQDLTILASTQPNGFDGDQKSNAIFKFHENTTLGAPGMYNVRFTNLTFRGRGLFMDGSGMVQRVVIENCHFDVRNGGHNNGIEFTTGLKDSSITNNVFSVGGENGIYGQYWNHLTIANNEFRDRLPGQPNVVNEGMHLVDYSPSWDVQYSFNLLVEQNTFRGLSRMGVEIQGGGTDTIVQDNYYDYSGVLVHGYTMDDTMAFSIPKAQSVNPVARRNYAKMDLSPPQPRGNAVLIAYEIGGKNVSVYDNYSFGGNHVIAGNGSNATGIAHDNRILSFREGPRNSNGSTIQYADGQGNPLNGPGRIVGGVYDENGPDVQLTWDTNRPKPGPGRRVFGLAIASGVLTAQGTALGDTLSLSVSGSNLVATLNAEEFIYPLASLSGVRVDLDDGTDTINVENLSLPVTIQASEGDDAVNVNVSGNGSAEVVFDTTQRIGALSIGAGGTVTVEDVSNDIVLTVTSLSIAGGGQLDINEEDIVIDYSGSAGTLVNDVRLHIQNGRILTSSSIQYTNVGYGDNAVLGKTVFSGQSVDSSSILIKFTYQGDADLDGDVDGVDVGFWAQHFTGELGGAGTMAWTQGDWDYDGDVDGVDVGLWAQAFTGDLGGGGLFAPPEGYDPDIPQEALDLMEQLALSDNPELMEYEWLWAS